MAKDEIKKVVAIGGSAGSLDIILKLVPELPASSGVMYIIIIHRKNDNESVLTELISARTSMKVREVEDKEPALANHIYIAPPDYHLLVENEHQFSLDCSEKIHFSRPSIDVGFESIADIFQQRVIGLLLSGANADGAEGMLKIRQAGGITIAQDPTSADVAYMPEQAIKMEAAELVLSPNEMGPYINRMLQ